MVLIRGVSGVRGITGTDVTPELARQYGRAFAEFVSRGDVAVGWDSRRGGDELRVGVILGLREGGARALDVGIVPTPTVGVVTLRRAMAGGVAVTASHNPEEYNGFKFFSKRGIFLDADEIGRFLSSVDSGATGRAELGPPPEELADAVAQHIGLVVSSGFVDAPAIARRSPKVVVDCVNAAGSVALPELLRRLGCDVVAINTTPGVGFPRPGEPVPESLGELAAAVVAQGADLGLACDPDADRLAVVDERGRAIGEEYTLAIASRVALSRRRGPVVVNASTSMMMDDLADEFGVRLHRSPVGEINVVAKMLDVSAVIGGEGNGGVILPDVHMGRDAAGAAALIVTAVASGQGREVSELVSQFRQYAMVKRKVAAPERGTEWIPEVMREAFPECEFDAADGAKASWPGRWVHVRASRTEPVVRIIAEAGRQDEAEALVSRVSSAIARITEDGSSCVE